MGPGLRHLRNLAYLQDHRQSNIFELALKRERSLFVDQICYRLVQTKNENAIHADVLFKIINNNSDEKRYHKIYVIFKSF